MIKVEYHSLGFVMELSEVTQIVLKNGQGLASDHVRRQHRFMPAQPPHKAQARSVSPPVTKFFEPIAHRLCPR
jgi:hypothetical protein